MKITNDILRQLITEEVRHYLAEETMQVQQERAIDQIYGILVHLSNTNINSQDVINKAKAKFEQNKDAVSKTKDPMKNEDAIDSPTTNEACGDVQSIDMGVDHHEGDHEGSMAKRQMFKTAQYAADIFDMIEDGQEFPAWIQSKMTKIADYIGAVKHYLEYDEVMGEKLDPDADAGDYVNDFQKSDNKRFKGKSKEKRREMAVAAYLDTKDDK